jgi:hypothetical protein
MLGGKHEAGVNTIPTDDEDINAKLVEAREFLEALESGKLHIGAPHEGRTEAKIYDLKRQIAMYQSILDKRHAPRS